MTLGRNVSMVNAWKKTELTSVDAIWDGNIRLAILAYHTGIVLTSTTEPLQPMQLVKSPTSAFVPLVPRIPTIFARKHLPLNNQF